MARLAVLAAALATSYSVPLSSLNGPSGRERPAGYPDQSDIEKLSSAVFAAFAERAATSTRSNVSTTEPVLAPNPSRGPTPHPTKSASGPTQSAFVAGRITGEPVV